MTCWLLFTLFGLYYTFGLLRVHSIAVLWLLCITKTEALAAGGGNLADAMVQICSGSDLTFELFLRCDQIFGGKRYAQK
jgi:hypothetical protein